LPSTDKYGKPAALNELNSRDDPQEARISSSCLLDPQTTACLLWQIIWAIVAFQPINSIMSLDIITVKQAWGNAARRSCPGKMMTI
jgi:hypothetical protein